MTGSEGLGKLPASPLHDMVIHPREKDLVLGTHGRSIIILDDIGPLARYGATTVTGNVSVAGYPDLPLTVEDYRELPIQVGNPTTISNDSSRCAGKRRSRRYRPSILKAERPTTGDSPTPPPKITDSPPTHLRSSAS